MNTLYIIVKVNLNIKFNIFFYLLECWDGEPDNRPLTHEVVKRLKTITSQSNVTIYQQQNDKSNQIDEKSALNGIEELSQMIMN